MEDCTIALLRAQGGHGRTERGADDGGHTIGNTLTDTITMTHPAHPLALIGSAIAVGFDPISILQPVAPGPLVSGRCVMALSDPVATLKPVTPLSSVDPPAFILHAESVPLPLGPVPLIGIPAGPGVHPYDLKAVRPGPGVFALALGSGTDAVPVGFAILPPPAVSATVVEVKPSARHSDKRLGEKTRIALLLLQTRASPGPKWAIPEPAQ